MKNDQSIMTKDEWVKVYAEILSGDGSMNRAIEAFNYFCYRNGCIIDPILWPLPSDAAYGCAYDCGGYNVIGYVGSRWEVARHAMENDPSRKQELMEHGHCPVGCEHPQPFTNNDGRELCGQCWFKCGIESEMIPCTPEFCE